MRRDGEKCNTCRLNNTWVDGRCASCGADEGALTDFLLARIAEDEAVARFCCAGFGARWRVTENGQTMVEDETGSEVIHYDGARNLSDVDHIARHDPARVLAECAAKRQVVQDARDMTADSGMYGHGWRLLEFLAMPYASHPEYQKRWKVERWKV